MLMLNGGSAPNVLHALSIAACLALMVAVCPAAVLDLTDSESSGSVGEAVFMQFSTDQATGSGVIDSFVRAQANDEEAGINILDPLEFDTKSGAFTRALALSDVPLVTMHGVAYREFAFDINEPNGGKSLLSLDSLKIHVEDTSTMVGYPTSFSAPVYDLDGIEETWIKLDAANSAGSGRLDMLAFIPSELLGTDLSKFVYLYFECGLNEASDGGFEEWAVSAYGPFAPEPSSCLLLLVAGAGLLAKRRSRKATLVATKRSCP